MDELAAKKSISSQELDEATARLKGGAGQLRHGRAPKRAQLDSRLAQVDQEIRAADIMRDYARITAPFAGVVTAEVGRARQPRRARRSAAHHRARRRATAWKSPSTNRDFRPSASGQTVTVTLDAIDRPLHGRVSEIVPSVDAASRTYIVKIDLPATPQLRSGMFGRAVFPLASHSVLTVPAGRAGGARPTAISLRRRRRPGPRSAWSPPAGAVHDDVEMLSGLNAGEKVIVPVPAGACRMAPGWRSRQ